jgi:hypothetical protein
MDNRKTKLENKKKQHKKRLEKGDFVQMYGYDVMISCNELTPMNAPWCTNVIFFLSLCLPKWLAC